MVTRREVETLVLPALEASRGLGFLGPGPVVRHVEHAWPLVRALPAEGLIADLGSGGGVPALILALACPATRWLLIESHHRRATWLQAAAAELGVADRVELHEGRAEDVGRGIRRGSAAAVTARSFARPCVTAECGAPLLAPGASLWVAEPPKRTPTRWPAAPLAELGLRLGGGVPGWAELLLGQACPDRYPRRVGIPAKRPLF
jgi:16S rRNA (guanine527-N7)-methyltransferase